MSEFRFPPPNEAARNGFTRLTEFIATTAGSVNAATVGRASHGVLATAGDDRTITMWRLGRASPLCKLTGHTTEIDSLAFNHNESLVVAGSRGGSLRVFDIGREKTVSTYSGHKSSVTALEYHPFGDVITSASTDCIVKVWDIRAKHAINTLKGHTGPVEHVHHSPDGKWVVSGDNRGHTRVWDLTTGKVVTEFLTNTRPTNNDRERVTGLSFHPSEFLLAVSGEKCVSFYDMESFQPISQTAREAHCINGITFDPQGLALLTAQSDSLRLWGWEPMECYDSLDCQWPDLCDMVVKPESLELLTVSIKGNTVSLHLADLTPFTPYMYQDDGDGGGDSEQGQENHLPSLVTPPKKSSILSSPNSAFFKAHASPMTVATPMTKPSQPQSQPQFVPVTPAPMPLPAQYSPSPARPSPPPSTNHDMVPTIRSGWPTKHSAAVPLPVSASVIAIEQKAMTPPPASPSPPQTQTQSALQTPPPSQAQSQTTISSNSVSPSATLIPAQPSQPMNLSLSSFLSPIANTDADADSDGESLRQSILESHQTMLTLLEARRSAFQSLLTLWSTGDLKQVFSVLNTIRDPLIINDFLQATENYFLGNSQLTFDASIELLAIIHSILFAPQSLKFEKCLLIGLKYLRCICRAFGALIIDVRKSSRAVNQSIIDLHREERIEKCELLFSNLQSIRESVLPKLRRRKESALAALTQEVSNLVESIVTECEN